MCVRVESICSAGCGWWLVLVWCERKILLVGWKSSQQKRANAALGSLQLPLVPRVVDG